MRWRRRARNASAGRPASTGTYRSSSLALRDRDDRVLAADRAAAGRPRARAAVRVVPSLDEAAARRPTVRRPREAAALRIELLDGVGGLGVAESAVVVDEHDQPA